jgi:hypothetical protein
MNFLRHAGSDPAPPSRAKGAAPTAAMIVVAGEALIDLIVRPDGQLVPVAGGGPYNTARAIGRLGLEVAWLGGLSRDHFGQVLGRARG